MKKLKKQFLSINNSLENYFNNLKDFLNNFKKIRFSQNKRFFLSISGILILIFSYLLIPTFYNKNLVQTEIENQVLQKYNINLRFNDNIGYGLLPKPHFFSKNTSILRDQDENEKKVEIGLVKNLKFFINISDFFQPKQIEIRDLFFKNTDFNIQKKDISFFMKLLETEPNENKIIIKDSNIFFKNERNEVLFINKIKNSKFFYDSYNLQNSVSSSNEIFNVPFKFEIKKNKFKKEITSKFSSKKLRLNIENQISYNNDIKDGLLELVFINKSTSLNYYLHKDFLKFSSNSRNKYEGLMEYKPFYFNAEFNYDGLNLKNFFNQDFIFTDLIKSEIFNNNSLNANINFNVKDITNIAELNNLFLKFDIEEGNLKFSDSNIMWKDDLKITLIEGSLHYDKNDINLIGRIILNFKNIDNFYRSFQVKKDYRKKIKEIEFDFLYNFSKNKVSFDNLVIDQKSNSDLEKFIDNFNSSENQILNKIKFKNFVSRILKIYSG